jgi:hypothetical protein
MRCIPHNTVRVADLVVRTVPQGSSPITPPLESLRRYGTPENGGFQPFFAVTTPDDGTIRENESLRPNLADVRRFPDARNDVTTPERGTRCIFQKHPARPSDPSVNFPPLQ